MHKRVILTSLGLATLLFSLVPTQASAQIVAFGASNTRGKGVKPAEAFPAQLAAILRQNGHPMTVRNAGVDGDTSAGMLARMNRSIPNGTRYVLLQVGGNDSRRGIDPGQRASNIAAIQQRLAARNIQVIDADAPVISALRSGLRQEDGIHLTPEGHKIVANQLAASIR